MSVINQSDMKMRMDWNRTQGGGRHIEACNLQLYSCWSVILDST